jgi:opacity protein-like surface antigen
MNKPIILALVVCFVLLSTFASAEPVSVSEAETLRVGAGFGIPYGNIGVKAEYLPAKYVGMFAGLGAADVGPAWAVGGYLYPLGKTYRINPRLLAMFGRVGTVEKFPSGEKDQLTGGAFGGGADFRITRGLTIDLDILYVAVDDAPSLAKIKGSRVRGSVGIGYRF